MLHEESQSPETVARSFDLGTTPDTVLNHPLVQRARVVAERDFDGIFRRAPAGSDLPEHPYFSHLDRVARLLAAAGYGPAVVAAGYLHDLLEDRPELWNFARLKDEFGAEVAELVDWVTQQDKSLPWFERNQRYNERLKQAPAEGRALSAADKTSNIEDSIVTMRAGFELPLKYGWRENSAKFHALDPLYEGFVAPDLLALFKNALTEFDRLGKIVYREH